MSEACCHQRAPAAVQPAAPPGGSILQVRRMRHRWTTVLPWVVVLAQCFVLVLLLLDPTRGASHCPVSVPREPAAADLCRWPAVASEGGGGDSGGKANTTGKNQDDEDLPGAKEMRDLIRESLRGAEHRPLSRLAINPSRVLYNRVPKAGSSTLMDLMIEMAQINNFTFTRAPEYMRFWLDEHWQEVFAERVYKLHTPVIYERHLHFMDISRVGHERPGYINIIRDPLDRLVSWYYFRRYQAGHIREMKTSKRVRTYDECVLGNHSECTQPGGSYPEEGYYKIIPFFCGQEAFCREPTEKALIQAIRNVKQHYTVIGVTEEFPKFVEALEHLLPRYFQASSRVYDALASEWKKKHQTTYKLPVSPEVRSIMHVKLKVEYQFYYFIKNRFKRLGEEIRLDKLSMEL